jgi:hypothetical protein
MSGVERSRPCIFSADGKEVLRYKLQTGSQPPAASERCAEVILLGAGIAGLACARALDGP